MLDLHLAVGLRRDDRDGAAFDQPGTQSVTVVAFVGDQIVGWRHSVDGLDRDLGIMRIAGRQQEDVRAALLVADGVEFGVPATFGDADTMSQGPPFAPPAVRWTLMQLLSMKSLSGTPSTPASWAKIRSHTPRSAQRRKRL